MIFQKSREISVLLVIQRNAEELALTSDFILSILYTHGIKSSGQAVSLCVHSCRSRGKMNSFLQIALALMFVLNAFKGKKFGICDWKVSVFLENRCCVISLRLISLTKIPFWLPKSPLSQ